MFYIYAYLRKDGTPYYIGKGTDNRAYENSGRAFRRPEDKNRFIIMESNLTELGAFALERRYIEWYGRKDLETGILRNRTDGGDGIYGFKHSSETRKKISESNKGKTKGRILSEDTRKKISNTMKDKKLQDSHRRNISESRKGMKLSDVHRKALSKAWLTRPPVSTETKVKMSDAKKGIKKEIVTCPYCQKTGGKPAMMRFHYDNCKQKRT